MNCVLFAKMDQVFSLGNRTLKNTGKMAKSTGKVREKSGNFVSPEKWEPCNKGNSFCDWLFSLNSRLWDLFSFHEIFEICRTGCARLFLRGVSEVPPLRDAGFPDFMLIGFSSFAKAVPMVSVS